MPFSLATRLWDTYLAEGSRLKGFLIYVAAAFLLSWSGPLRTMDFQVHRSWPQPFAHHRAVGCKRHDATSAMQSTVQSTCWYHLSVHAARGPCCCFQKP